MKLLVAAILVSLAVFFITKTASGHRLAGHPKTLEARLSLAKRQVQHDRRELAGLHKHQWRILSPIPVYAVVHAAMLARDISYVVQLRRLLNPRLSVDACLSALIWRESRWDVHATNPSTGAYGLPQALPGSKMASAGPDWRHNPWTQIRWMVGYVNSRYGGSCAALSFQRTNGYY